MVAFGTRDPKRRARRGFSGARILDGYQAVIDDPEVKPSTSAAPMHAEWAIKAAEANKHVLSEKPIAAPPRGRGESMPRGRPGPSSARRS
jgi:predicted dehydrogenase